jgi:hypothetical protein
MCMYVCMYMHMYMLVVCVGRSCVSVALSCPLFGPDRP